MRKYFQIVFIFSILINTAFSGQKAEWKGTIKVEDGVTVVYNPQDPIYKNNIFSMEEELSIERKSAKHKEEMFQNIVSLVIDSANNIYILDKKAANIKIFNKDGNIFKIIGRRGEGPGEFVRPENVALSPNNYPPFQGFILDEEGRIFVHRFVEVEKSKKHYFDVFDDEGKYLTKITLDEKFLFGTFKNKKLFTIEEDEDGYKYVRRYKVTWKY